MNEPQRLDISVVNEGALRKPQVRSKRPLTLEVISEMIRRLNLDEYTTRGLIELASKYPHAALPSFKKNINLMIQRVRAKRTDEQKGEVQNDDHEEKREHEEDISLDQAFAETFDDTPEAV